MQFINKQNTEPIDWNAWFTVPPDRRTFDYGIDSGSLPRIREVKQFLINEQNSLCAYCQQKIDIDNSSIEHVTPKEHNKELSTSYLNLVAVCNKNQVKDPLTGKFHCDRERGSNLIPPVIFYSNTKSVANKTNIYFTVYSSGEITAKPGLEINIRNQIEAFINILNLNHSILKANIAKDALRGIIDAYRSLPDKSPQKSTFWRKQYNRILNNQYHPFREYLLVFIGSKIGLN